MKPPEQTDFQGDMETSADYLLRLREAACACTEAELLIEVKKDFSEEFWSRFYVLADKLEEETMTVAENEEFRTYTDQTEASTVERLVHLTELGRRRGVTALDLIKQLGLRTGESHLRQVE